MAMRVEVWTGGHTIAESILKNPPDGVEIVSTVELAGRTSGSRVGERVSSVPRNLQVIADQLVYKCGIPRFLPSLIRTDLIHTVSGLIPIVPRPWITTISMPSSFFGLNDDWYQSRRRRSVLRWIMRSSNCRKITCFSNSTLEGLRWTMGEGLDKETLKKLEVLYPAIDTSLFPRQQRRSDGVFRILFIGNHFFDKGGREIHKAASQLATKYDLRLDIVTSAPPHHADSLHDFVRHHQEPWCHWHIPRVSRRELVEDFFPNSDVFAMCSYIDAFGFVLVEALAAGLPLIAANVYAQREIVDDGVNGFLIDTPSSAFEGNPSVRTQRSVEEYRKVILEESGFNQVATDIRERLRTLIEDSRLRTEMGKKSYQMASEGRFSIRIRNQQLKRIYEEAVA